MVLVCSGMRRGGSTLLYNIVCRIAEFKYSKVRKQALEEYEELKEFISSGNSNIAFVVKCHRFIIDILDKIKPDDAVYLYVHRDPRDAVLSYSRMYNLSLRETFESGFPDLIINEFNKWTASKRVFVFRYDELCNFNHCFLKFLGNIMSVPIEESDAVLLMNELSLKSQVSKIKNFNYNLNGVFTGVDYVDPDSQLHNNHIGSGKSNQWASLPWYVKGFLDGFFYEHLLKNKFAINSNRMQRYLSMILFKKLFIFHGDPFKFYYHN